jgi:hypothetical protein
MPSPVLGNPERGNGGPGRTGTHPLPTLGWVWGSYGSARGLTIAKDVTQDVAAVVATVVVVADNPGAAAAESGLRDRARAATPGGTSRNRNAGATTPTTPRSTRSNQAADRSAPRNLQEWLLGAGPRTPRGAQEQAELARPGLATPAARAQRPGGAVADNAGTAAAGASCRPRWPARCGWPAGVASVALRCGSRPSSNGSGDGWGDRNARSP